MVYSLSPSLAESRLNRIETEQKEETLVRDGDESDEELFDAYQRAAAYRQHLTNRQQASLLRGKHDAGAGSEELSDLEIMERRLMGYDSSLTSPEKYECGVQSSSIKKGALAMRSDQETLADREKGCMRVEEGESNQSTQAAGDAGNSALKQTVQNAEKEICSLQPCR